MVEDEVERAGAQVVGAGLGDALGEVGEVDAVGALRDRHDRHDRQVEEPGGAGQADAGGADGEQHVPAVAAQRAKGEEQGLRVDVDAFVQAELTGDQLMTEALGAAVLEQGAADLFLGAAEVVAQMAVLLW
ncbi:hypothetical protein [Streptomyces sp. NPDC090025]|uniref:hypothetical protein n=1 Tax=Streptomyces sp. NPDC090025 TaxID=3365922 RepID=UPI0038371645